MKYPKSVMRKTELMKMGFPETFLIAAFRRKGQTYAWKMNPTKRNSPIVFDTEAFEKWRINVSGRRAGGKL